MTLSPALDGSKIAKRMESTIEIGTGHSDNAKGSHGIFCDMTTRRADIQLAGLAIDDRPNGRAVRRAFEIRQPEVGLGMLAERQNMFDADMKCCRLQPLELRIVAVEDHRTAGQNTLENFSLGVGDLFETVEVAEMCRCNGGDDGHMRLHLLHQRTDFVRMVHAHFEHAEFGIGGRARPRLRHAPASV